MFRPIFIAFSLHLTVKVGNGVLIACDRISLKSKAISVDMVRCADIAINNQGAT